MLTIAGIISTDLFALYMMKRFITMFFGLNVDHKKQEWMLYGLFLFLWEYRSCFPLSSTDDSDQSGHALYDLLKTFMRGSQKKRYW